MVKHQKHTNLIRRQNDHYASNEISILGTNCGVITELVQKLSEYLSNYKLAYFDASHAQNVVKNKIKKLFTWLDKTSPDKTHLMLATEFC